MHLSFLIRLHNFLRSFRGPLNPADIPPGSKGKSYERFPQIPLVSTITPTQSLAETLMRRRSPWSAFSGTLSFEYLSAILAHAGQAREGMRPHPSGGARYPLETYVLAFSVSDLAPGVYHYNPEENALAYLWAFKQDAETPAAFVHTDGICDKATALIVTSALWERSSSKYKGLAFELTLTESGHLAQNHLLVAAALTVPARPLFSFDDAALASLIDMDPRIEQPIYVVALGAGA